MASVSLKEFEKVLNTLNEALDLHKKSKNGSIEELAFRDTCIQRFEFCVELAWKVSKKVLGTASAAPRTVVREMAQDGVITNPELWLTFVDARNKSSHTYDEEIAIEVFDVVQQFPPEGSKLLQVLGQR
jgi:nucleotidyltransferase substrate binding protein (TIGR01987 family)